MVDTFPIEKGRESKNERRRSPVPEYGFHERKGLKGGKELGFQENHFKGDSGYESNNEIISVYFDIVIVCVLQISVSLKFLYTAILF